MPIRFSRSLALRLVVASTLAAAAVSPAKPPYHVGYRLVNVDCGEKTPLVVALWYPTLTPGRPTVYARAMPHLRGTVALDAEPARGPFPLIVFSHGGIGAGVAALSWAEGLAERGFVVAGPDHHDKVVLLRSDATGPPSGLEVVRALEWARRLSRQKEEGGVASSEYAHRPKETRAVIDHLLRASADEKSPLHGLVDADRIGMTGVSFGSWTTLAMSGGVAAFHDPRIKAAIPVAPSAGRVSLERITIPLMYIFGEKETLILLDKRPNARLKEKTMLADYARARPPRFLVGIRGAEHLDFDADGMTTRGWPRRQQGGDRKVYDTAQVRRRDPVMRTVLEFETAFWRRYLLGDLTVEKFLAEPDEQAVYLYKYDFGRRKRAAG